MTDNGPAGEATDSKGMEADELSALSVSFFLMPIDMLRSIYDDFERVACEKEARITLFKHGFDCGQLIIRRIHNYDCMEDFLKNLPDIWIEMGLGIITVVPGKDGSTVFECTESNEAKARGNIGKFACNFSRGYLAGMITAATGKTHDCEETLCISRGDDICSFRVIKKE